VIALPRGRDIALVRADGSQDRTVLSLKPGEFVADVALSPDGTRIAFGIFTAGGSGPGGSDIALATVGLGPGEHAVVVPRDRPGMLLAAPSWSPDGAALVFEGVGLDATGKPTIFSDWVAADGSGRRRIADDARFPAFSPDGREIAYVRNRATGDGLYVRALDGGSERELVSETRFVAIVGPCYAPDGSSIAFAGVPDRPGLLPKLPGAGLAGTVVANPTEAHAVAGHGMPADAYTVPTSGGDPRLAALLSYDDLALTWSPDGAWLAVSGALGLKLVRLADGAIQPVTENGSFGAIDWR
jgi:Tol biopolymer transport system component